MGYLDTVEEAEEYLKAGYYLMKEYLPTLPGNPVAVSDSYTVGTEGINYIDYEVGLLSNDFSFDGAPMEAVLVKTPLRGLLQLDSDGSFSYLSEPGFTGMDEFTYRVKAGFNWSETVTVTLDVSGSPVGRGFAELYPNPVQTNMTIRSGAVIDKIEIMDVIGRRVKLFDVNSTEQLVNTSGLTSGVYYARIFSGDEVQVKKFVVIR